MKPINQSRLGEEEKIIAELSALDVNYLSRNTDSKYMNQREKAQLMADIIRQPSSRVRSAIIAVLLIHPELAGYIPHSIESLRGKNRSTLKLFYTAAVYLQKKHEMEFHKSQGNKYTSLPDYFSQGLGLSNKSDPDMALTQLAEKHQQLIGLRINWEGTYRHVLEHIFPE